MKPVAMVGWSGFGRYEDLERTALRKLAANKKIASRLDDALLVSTDDPVAVARSLAFLPGVAWIAVGFRFKGSEGYLSSLGLLGKRYLSKGKSFRISAHSARSDLSAGDIVLAGSSELLSLVAGAKVDERKPQVNFRVSMEGEDGACGAEIRGGPGGRPTGRHWVSCLVSGGENSSSLAWMAVLSGFSVRLVHSWTGDEAFRRVARLYSELSFRMDARCLELVVLQGGESPFGRISRWLQDHDGQAFAGLRSDRPDTVRKLSARFPNLALPLVLLQQDSIGSTYRSLGIGRAAEGAGGMTVKAMEGGTPYSESRFGGVQADSNAVIDAIKRRS